MCILTECQINRWPLKAQKINEPCAANARVEIIDSSVVPSTSRDIADKKKNRTAKSKGL